MIEDLLPVAWPEAVIAAVGAFRQGDLIESPPVFFAGVAAHAVTTLVQETGDAAAADELFELADRPAYGMITTETCDISEGETATPKQPFVLVSPVYEISKRVPEAVRRNVERDRIGYIRRLTAPDLPEGLWIVDLRLEVPLEKSFLAGRAPIFGFETDKERLRLADFLAARRDRPVLSNELHAALVKPLRRWLEGLNPDRQDAMLGALAEIRLAIAGSRSQPDGAGLILITDKKPLPDSVRELWDTKWENLRNRMEQAGMSLVGNAYETYDTLSARKYIESVRIDLTFQ